MTMPTAAIDNVEHWNDTFAREHDIDAYYVRSGCVMRFVEQRRLACIRRMMDVQSGDRILEVGCGGGHVLRMFPQAQLTGVDVSGEMLAKARHNLQGMNATLWKGELSALDLPAGSFDKVVCTETLEHTVDPAEVLSQIHRLLRPGGRAVITFPNDRLVNRLKDAIRTLRLTILPPFRRLSWGGDHYHLHVWSVPEMRSLLNGQFEVVQEQFAPSRMLPIRCCFHCVRS